MKLIIKAILALLVIAIIAAVPLSFAFGDSLQTITRTITYTASAEDPTQVPETLESNNETWGLAYAEVKSVPQKVESKKTHTETVQCWPEEVDATAASFASEMEIEDGATKRSAKLTSVNPIPVSQDIEIECNQAIMFEGLPSNDMAQIPEMWTGMVDGCPVEVTLGLAGCSWAVSSVDEFGMPKTYAASVLYRGLATYYGVHHYDVEATYVWEGQTEAEGGMRNFTVTAVYEPQGAPLASEEEPLWLPFAIIAVAGVGGFGFAFAAWRRRNATFYRGEDGAFKKVARGRAKRLSSGNLALNFPAVFDLSKNPYKIELRRDIVGSKKIIVLQQGEPVYEGRANEIIDIKMVSFAPSV